jgi:hypothetical protein
LLIPSTLNLNSLRFLGIISACCHHPLVIPPSPLPPFFYLFFIYLFAHRHRYPAESPTSTSRLDGLDIFVMPQNLKSRGDPLSLKFLPGYVLVFKSTRFDLEKDPGSQSQESHLDLYNVNDDIILRMTFRAGQKKIFCNDRASKSLRDGWGKERSVDLGPLDFERLRGGVTISLRTFWSDDFRITRYQILLDLTTLCYFDSRFPGPATQMSYSQRSVLDRPQLSDPVQVVSYKIEDLQPEERRVIESGR